MCAHPAAPVSRTRHDRVNGPFDIVIINSVLQCFSGHNYLRDVTRRWCCRRSRADLSGQRVDQDLKRWALTRCTPTGATMPVPACGRRPTT